VIYFCGFAIGVALAGLGEHLVAIFSEVDDFTDEAGEDVQEAGVFEGIFSEFFFQARR